MPRKRATVLAFETHGAASLEEGLTLAEDCLTQDHFNATMIKGTGGTLYRHA